MQLFLQNLGVFIPNLPHANLNLFVFPLKNLRCILENLDFKTVQKMLSSYIYNFNPFSVGTVFRI